MSDQHWPMKLTTRKTDTFIGWGCERDTCSAIFETKAEWLAHVDVPRPLSWSDIEADDAR